MAIHEDAESFINAIQVRFEEAQEKYLLGLQRAADEFAEKLRQYMPVLSGDAQGGVLVRYEGQTVIVAISADRFQYLRGFDDPRYIVYNKPPHGPAGPHSKSELSKMKRLGGTARYNMSARNHPWESACEEIGLKFIELKDDGQTFHIITEPTEYFLERLKNGV